MFFHAVETACIRHGAEALAGFTTGDLVAEMGEPRLGLRVRVGEIEADSGAAEVLGDEFSVLKKGGA